MSTQSAPPKTTDTTSSASDHSVISAGDFKQIQEELDIMLDYAINNGLIIPTTISTNSNPDSATVIANYNTLVSTVAPSTVQSIRFINTQVFKEHNNRAWYKTPLFSRCLILAGISLIVLIGISLIPSVNEENQARGILSSSGLTLLYNLLFVISASLLGVMFYLLKTISSKIKNYTLLPVDAIELNATILIGIISGFIISELFTISGTALGGTIVINRMTLALLGGFSSDAIFSILQGVVNKIKLFLTPTT